MPSRTVWYSSRIERPDCAFTGVTPMANDGQPSGRNAALTALSGGLLATGGPMMLVVAAAVAFSSLVSSPPSAPTRPTEESKKEATEDTALPPSDAVAPFDDADVTLTLQPLWAHLGPALNDSGKSQPVKTLSDAELEKELARLDVQVVVATLPDPVETGSKYEFDMGLEAIQKAIESEGYLIDRFSNPWGSSGSKPGESAHGTLDYRRHPACLVFRAGDERTRLQVEAGPVASLRRG